MHNQTRRAIKIVQDEGGKILVSDDLDALLEIERLACAMDKASHAAFTDMLDKPAMCGDIELFRLSWGAAVWLTETRGWFADTPLEMMQVAFAMAHARQPTAFAGRMGADRQFALSCVRSWAQSVPQPVEALAAAIEKIMPAHRDNCDRKDTQADELSLLTRLVAFYSLPPERFLYSMPIEKLDAYVKTMLEQKMLQAALHDKRVATDNASAEQVALYMLSKAVKAFAKQCRERNATAERTGQDPEPDSAGKTEPKE